MCICWSVPKAQAGLVSFIESVGARVPRIAIELEGRSGTLWEGLTSPIWNRGSIVGIGDIIGIGDGNRGDRFILRNVSRHAQDGSHQGDCAELPAPYCASDRSIIAMVVFACASV